MIVGVNEHMDWGSQSDPNVRGDILDKMAAAGFTSIRLDYAWGSIQPNSKTQWDWVELDKYIGEADARGLSVLIMLYWPPGWSSAGGKNGVPGNYADYGRVLGEIGKRYGDKLAGIEMWNEPDLDGFWEGTVDQFAEMLAEAYPIARDISPFTTYLAAAPTYLGLATNWFADCYAHDTYRPGRSYDAQGIHPYMSPSDLPPDAPKSKWSITGIEDLQALRSQYDDDSDLWVTEFGWSTHNNSGYGSDIPNHKRGVTEQQQSDFYIKALDMFRDYGIVAAYLYTDEDMPGEDDQEAFFGLLYSDQKPKPVVAALTEYLADNTDPENPDVPDNADLEARVADLESRLDELADHLAAAAEALR